MKKKPIAARGGIEICILAGGLSTRMGRDKSRLRLGRRTLLGQVRAAARQTGLPVRVIRRDLVPRCGPLGGICTALATTDAAAVLFLACDMPFVTAALIRRVIARSDSGQAPVFATANSRAGFPFLLPRRLLTVADELRRAGDVSLQSFARKVRARGLALAPGARAQFNVNTPHELRAARKHSRLREKHSSGSTPSKPRLRPARQPSE